MSSPGTPGFIAGTAYLSVDGNTFALVGEFAYSPGAVSREPAPGMDGIHGFMEKPRSPYIKAKIRDLGGLSIASLNAMTNVTVTCELANGKVVTGRNMWANGEQEAESAEATCDVQWNGFQNAVQEQLAA